MLNLYCLRHPHFKGQKAPVLACKACCAIFVQNVKEEQKIQTPGSPDQWLEEKKQQGKAAKASEAKKPSLRRC